MTALPEQIRALVERATSWTRPRVAPRDTRTNTTCRNCGVDAPGAYCATCGQETALELPKAMTFLREAAGRYVAFDGRMWRTLAALLFRPGFLTREYLDGRRKRYVRPARLVLVLAIVLFAVARFFADPATVVRIGTDSTKRTAAAKGADASVASNGKGTIVELDDEPVTITTPVGGVRIDPALNVNLQAPGLPFADVLKKPLESFNRLDPEQKQHEIVAGMLRYGPYAMIALLPAFALLMQVLYLGRSGRYPGRPRRYAEHLVYGAHSHAFVALVVALMIVVPWTLVGVALVAWSVIWQFASLHAVYGGRWSGAIVRGVVATVVYSFLFVLAVVSLFLAAIVLR